MTNEKRPYLTLLWFIYAFAYDVILLLKPYTATLHTVCEILRRQKAVEVFDAGCGTGNLALFTSKYGVSSTIGVDSSKGMLLLALLKKKVFRNRLRTSSFSEGNLETGEGLPKHKFDAVVSFGVLHAVTNPSAVTQRLVDMLKPQGILILVIPLPVSMKLIIIEHIRTAGIFRLLLSILASPFFAVSIVVNLIEESWQKKGHLHFMTVEEVENLVTRNNLTLLESKVVFGNAYAMVVGTLEKT